MGPPAILVRRLFPAVVRRPRRALTPAVRSLEGRCLLTGGAPTTAVMSQTVTFPDLESNPALSTQGVLYFSPTMGTLTEVDLVTSGAFTSQFSAENLASTSRTIEGTTAANLSIGVPTGSIPVSIPAVTQSFNASAYDGTLDYAGTSGATLPEATSSSTPQTMVLTSPADLAAFTGHFRIPISVSGHATGSTTPDDGQVASTFDTDTSATITVIYHYLPNLSGSDPSSGSSASPAGGGTTSTTAPNTGSGQAPLTLSAAADSTSSTHAHTRHHAAAKARVTLHRDAHPLHRIAPAQAEHARQHPRDLVRTTGHQRRSD